LGENHFGLFDVKVSVWALSDTVLLQLVMPVRREPMARQTTLDARQRAAIQGHDGAPDWAIFSK
jgi:hypothetical protein